ncbi:19699_t:CDS:2 [Funneliformis geosporum]|nr:19699_t:CDS:2 [Funneliformis geosporum]
MNKKLISLFSGAGGLDLDTRSIIEIKSAEIPNCDGIIGGSPCQSWSLAGSQKGKNGIKDHRGTLIYEYLRIVKAKKPSFFVFENVAGILSPSNQKEFSKFKKKLENLGYNITYRNLNAKDYGIPQDRKRVFLIGICQDLPIFFDFNKISEVKKPVNLHDCIADLQDLASNKIANHEYYEGTSGRHSPLHPSASMTKQATDKFIFAKKNVRRLTVRECARIQTFPDNFVFKYQNINDGYKMVGNAVPVLLAYKIANELKKTLKIEKIIKIRKPKELNIQPRLNNIYENNPIFRNIGEVYKGKVISTNRMNRQGSNSRPPDFITRDGIAVEVKKMENTSTIHFNSSYPKKYFPYPPDKNKEERISLDTLYIIAKDKDKQGNTVELGRYNEIDPLKITDLRIRGMYQVKHPKEVFDYLLKDIQLENNKTNCFALILESR